MVECAIGRRLKGRRQVQYLPSVLKRDNPPRREHATVARTINLEQDRLRDVAGMDEIGVQRMARSPCDRCGGSHEGLGHHTAAEDA